MDTTITVVQILLTFFAGGAGLLRLATPHARFTKLPAQGWAHDFKPGHVKLIGALEVGAAVGIIAPLLLGSLMMLTTLAAVGIALVMAGAMATHLRRAEYLNMAGNLIWLGLALFLAYSTLVEFAV
jgi:hypothetical protein